MDEKAMRIGSAEVADAVARAIGVEADRIRGLGQDEVELVSGGTVQTQQPDPTTTAGMWPTGDPTGQQAQFPSN